MISGAFDDVAATFSDKLAFHETLKAFHGGSCNVSWFIDTDKQQLGLLRLHSLQGLNEVTEVRGELAYQKVEEYRTYFI